MKQSSSFATLEPGPTNKSSKTFNIAHIYEVLDSGYLEEGGDCHYCEEQCESESHETAMYVRRWGTGFKCRLFLFCIQNWQFWEELGLWLSVSSNWHHKLFSEKMPLASSIVRLQSNWEQALGVHKEFLMRFTTSDSLGWRLYEL